MRCNWRRWLWGVIPLVMLSWLAVQTERVRIEQELTETAVAALLQSGASWAKVGFQGRDAVLSGKAWDEEDADTAYDLVRDLRGVRHVDSRTALIEKADAYHWAASRRNNRIRLSGFVPNLATRQAILGVTKANFPGHEVVDRMALMRGVPSADTWLGGVSFALKQLGGMRRGEVRLEDLGLSIIGAAEDAAAYRTIKTALNNVPKGIKLNLDQLTAPEVSPYVWAARFADGKFELSGYFPDAAAHQELLAAAKAGARGADPVDGLQPGEGAPQGWAAVTVATVRALAMLETGSAEMKDATLLVSGVSADEPTAEAARGLLRASLPPSIKLTEQIRAREPRRAADDKRDAPLPKAESLTDANPQRKQEGPEIRGEAKAQDEPKTPADTKTGNIPTEAKTQVETKTEGETKTEVEAKAQVEAKAKVETKAPGDATVKTPVETKPQIEANAQLETKAQIEARTCQATLEELTKAGQILFERARAQLNAASSATLAKIAAAVKACPDVIVRIEGHTDMTGSQTANQALSQRRAQSVLDFLVVAGVDARQLEPVGYGELRPVAPNDTRENRSKNRRIEFAVRPK